MDAKLTTEQAIELLKSSDDFIGRGLEKELVVQMLRLEATAIASLLESHARDAALGRLALEARNNYICGGKFESDDNGTCESCTMYKFCLRVGKENAE
jgi:hypothetical protein